MNVGIKLNNVIKSRKKIWIKRNL